MNNQIITYKKNKIKEIINTLINKITKKQRKEIIVSNENVFYEEKKNDFKKQIIIKKDFEQLEILVEKIKNRKINLDDISDEQLEIIERNLKEYLKKLKQTYYN